MAHQDHADDQDHDYDYEYEDRGDGDGDHEEAPADWRLPLSFVHNRHRLPQPQAQAHQAPAWTSALALARKDQASHPPWRMKDKYKTHCVALVLCLNIGVEPPDVVKTNPCARMECWIDPTTLSPHKSLEVIGNNLRMQYEQWQPRARYKQSLDPTSEEVNKLCCSLRRNAKDDRVLFHYNGHGVPKPTNQGEIWVFNRSYTQYIPLSVYDLQTWMGAPSLYVYDCSNAGIIVEQFKVFAEQHERDWEGSRKDVNFSQSDSGTNQAPPSYKNCIQLAACAKDQILPMNPELPADVFTSCLTTPIKMAIKWFVIQNHPAKIIPPGTNELIDKIPGQLTDRRTMIGELNWIFTAITDTIAWNTLPRDLFQQLFRADLLTASLCRNFLLADRILRSYNCTPVSSPEMPSMAGHPMWQAWDQTLDLALAQLPAMLEQQCPYVHSSFFEEQLTAFQVWLDLEHPRSIAYKILHATDDQKPDRLPPDQLPMVLQVLLSTIHRVRALEILSRFLALGPWAVNLILSVGIFPYMVKLLQTSAKELRPLLVFIWAKIMAVDVSCQADLVNAKGHKYFLVVLQDTTISSEHRTLAAFVLAGIVDNYLPGQEAALQGSLLSICLEQLNDKNPLLRQWLAICLGRLWKGYDQARWSGVRDMAHEKLYMFLDDPVPEVRAAVVFALGTFISSVRERTEHANTLDQQVAVNLAKIAYEEMSPIVRAELLAALQWLVLTFEPHFIAVSLQEQKTVLHQRGGSRERNRMYSGGAIDTGYEALDISAPSSPAERMKRVSSSSSITSMSSSYTLQGLPTIGFGSVYMKLWSVLCSMCNDPYPKVFEMCNEIVNYIKNQVIDLSSSRELCVEVKYGNSTGISGSAGSSSLPPSPSTKGTYINEHSRTLPSRIKDSRSKKPVPGTIPEDLGSSPVSSRGISIGSHRPIVKTEFVNWASSHFAECSQDGELEKQDIESKIYQERQWRYGRNRVLRREAREEQKRMTTTKLESQVFNTRSSASPSVIIFHPYDQHIAAAARDSYDVWDWGTGAKLSYGHMKAINGNSRISALQYINAHDAGRLLLCGSSCGAICLYQLAAGNAGGGNRPGTGSREARLVTAWRALGEPKSHMINQNPNKPTGPGLVMEWQQATETLAVAGMSKFWQIWDAQIERRILDAATDADCAATCISRRGRQLALGFADGSVGIWDLRTPRRKAHARRDHQTMLLQAHILFDNKTLISGCQSGEIRIYDLRKTAPLYSINCQGMTAMAVHKRAGVFACGFSNQHIGIYNKNTNLLNMIKFHESFMGPRVGPVSCLSFHPERCALAVGARDSTVSVYSTDPRR